MKTIRGFWSILLMLVVQMTYGQVKRNASDTVLKNLDPARAEIATSLVASYARLFFKGENIDSLASLCSLPFAWDRKKVIENWADFKKEQKQIIDQKGKNRPVVIDSVYVTAIRKEILDWTVPVNIYYVVLRIKFDQKGVDKTANAFFAVEMNEQPKIVGFSD